MEIANVEVVIEPLTDLDEAKEAAYLQGRKAVLREQLGAILRELGDSEDLSREWLLKERAEAIETLRGVCEDYGDNDWKDDLHLSDIITKHLGDYLD